ncbi:MAG: putative glycosyl transferase, group 1 family protein, partial [Herminiimonas sp.]|nr:putative glycosyl transferase, group 1 family protein [Herminiimonas sp.]
MHVLNVNHTLDPVTGGGTAERTIKMSQFLARAGVTCKVLAGSAGFDAARFPPQEKLRFVTVPLLSKRFFIPLISGARLRRLVDEADVIHLMGHWSLLNALVYRAARRLGKPYVVCPAGALPIYGRSRLFKRLYNLIVGNKLIRNASAKIAITEAERDHFRSYGIAPH